MAGRQKPYGRVTGLAQVVWLQGWRPHAGEQNVCVCPPGKVDVCVLGGGSHHSCVFQAVEAGQANANLAFCSDS